MAQRQQSSDGFGIVSPARPDEAQSVDRSALSRYDIVLWSIPLLLLVGWILGQLTSAPNWVTLAAAAVVALPLVADGLAVNPPE